ncbi:MAG: aldo/keto reductase [Spirochaetaceae bacterium]|nr:MAG: aldo/keto reductase [Spirochaetaceae bacterium]
MGFSDTTELSNGVKLPWLGLGVYKVTENAEDVIRAALDIGYRCIDTAAFYGNELEVGRAIRASGIPREEIFVTTKLWNDDQGYERALSAFERSREALGLEVVDLYLIHWPVQELYCESWFALEKLYRDGKARAIGVSNFAIPHITRVLREGELTPMLNQVEFHPFVYDQELLNYCMSMGIQLQAYSPLARAKRLNDPVLTKIAQHHNKKPSQIILRWGLEHGVATIPKTVNPERMRENADIFDFQLSDEEVAAIDALACNERIGVDPRTMPA